MLKVDKGNVEIEGTRTTIQSELTTLLYALSKDKVLKNKDIDMAVEMSRKDTKELKEMFIKKMADLFDIELSELGE